MTALLRGMSFDRDARVGLGVVKERSSVFGPLATHGSRLLTALCLVATSTPLAACSAPVIAPERVAKIEVRNLTAAEKMMEGDEVRKLLEGAVCHQGDVKWRGGYPATIFLDNGRDFEVDGFSYYEPVLRVSRKQWCDLGEKQYKAVFGELLAP